MEFYTKPERGVHGSGDYSSEEDVADVFHQYFIDYEELEEAQRALGRKVSDELTALEARAKSTATLEAYKMLNHKSTYERIKGIVRRELTSSVPAPSEPSTQVVSNMEDWMDATDRANKRAAVHQRRAHEAQRTVSKWKWITGLTALAGATYPLYLALV